MARSKKVLKEEAEVVEPKVRTREEIMEQIAGLRLRGGELKLQSIIIELLLDIRDKG